MFRKHMMKGFLLIVVVCMMIAVPSCSSLRERMVGRKDESPVISPTDQVVLLNKGRPTYDMIFSDELLTDMTNHHMDTLKETAKYFHVVVNEEIEENVIYIRARKEDMNDAEDGQNLPSADTDNKEAGISSGSEETNRQGQEAENAAFAKILSQAKVVIRQAVSYSKEPYREMVAQRTAALYRSSAELLAQGNLRSLKYKDYCIVSDQNEIAIVCGSLESAVGAMEYLRTGYIDKGELRGDFYLIEQPKNESYRGNYLDPNISGKSLNEYTIVYSKDETYYDSESCVTYLNDYFWRNLGSPLPVNHYSYSAGVSRNLVIGKTPYPISDEFYRGAPDIWDYLIECSGEDLYILGGSDWALQYAVDQMIDAYFSQSKNIPEGFRKSGSIYGMCLYEKYEGANLRLMTNNVWDKPCNTAPWIAQGEDCSNNYRFKEMAKAYMAYNPDVLALQEINHYYINSVVQSLNASGRYYKVADHTVAGRAYRNWTPIIYNTETVKLLDGDSHTFRYASNKSSKSYTWGYFEENKTKKRFVVFSVHLWWRKTTKEEPNNSLYREKQLEEVCTKANELIETYNCPCFIMGDLNCTVSAKEYSVLETMGYADCYGIASEYAENLSGRYVCNGKTFSYKVTDAPYRKSIDHIAAKNLKKTKVLTYDYVTPNFYGKLSDHAPLYVDVKLN